MGSYLSVAAMAVIRGDGSKPRPQVEKGMGLGGYLLYKAPCPMVWGSDHLDLTGGSPPRWPELEGVDMGKV